MVAVATVSIAHILYTNLWQILKCTEITVLQYGITFILGFVVVAVCANDISKWLNVSTSMAVTIATAVHIPLVICQITQSTIILAL